MIRVQRQPEPCPPDFDFDREVRQPGLSALAELTGQPPTMRRPGPRIHKQAERIKDLNPAVLRQYDYWTRALGALHKAYHGYCAYACIYIEPLLGPTVDHFVAVTRAEDPRQAYEWDNYRLACSLMNACKNAFSDVLDPFIVEDGWFLLNLDTFEVESSPELDTALRERVEDTIRRLKLNSSECKDMRRRWFHMYWQPKEPGRPLPLWFLEQQAPFLAREMRRQGRVRPDEQVSLERR